MRLEESNIFVSFEKGDSHDEMEEAGNCLRQVRAFYSKVGPVSNLINKLDISQLSALIDNRNKKISRCQQYLSERQALTNIGYMLYRLLTEKIIFEESACASLFIT